MGVGLLLCVQAVTAKGRPKFEKKEGKHLSGYKHCYAYKNQSLEARHLQ